MHQKQIINKIDCVLQATEHGLVDNLLNAIDNANRIFITGAGRSGLVARFFAMRLMHSDYKVFIVGEIVTPTVKSGDLFIVVSGSGSTETLLPLVKKAKAIGVKVAVISMKSASPMADLADVLCVIGSLNPNSFAVTKGMPMGTVFELSALIFLEAIVAFIVNEKGLTEEKMRALHANLE